jgi:DNA polymerase elongation subunit (family B)/intein/homing endonuclease
LQETVDKEPTLADRLASLTKPVDELDEGLLVSATYDGDDKVAVLKFYDAQRGRVWLWEDRSGHQPYCYSRLPMAEVRQAVAGRRDIVEVREETKQDLLNDAKVTLRKIIATDPLAIGGNPGKSLRDFLECWEADIKYFENFVYDKGLKVGTYYRIANGSLFPIDKEVGGDVKRSLDSILAKTTGDAAAYIKAWAELLGQPLAAFKRIACDIEVANEENRIPDPEIADRQVIAVSFYNDKESVVYMLDKTGQDKSLEGALTGYTYKIFADEASLLRATFSKMLEYPFLVTFNGDDFDLRYLKHRAMRKEIGVREEEIPISLQRQEASLKHGVHIDLYRFFNNRSIQVYVYNNRYTEHTLNGIAEAILGKEKIPFEGDIAELPLVKLADYCLNDSALTYELTAASDSLLMKMLLVISRIAKMPMNDVARLGVSNWIRSMLYYDHRRIGALIPRSDELRQKGGSSSEAIIKGKKYKGGLVIEPKPGIYFGVSVLDFASLYPSIIKVHNLSYETVNCPHEECHRNKVPDTEHWVCTKRSGVESLLIGSLRDLRVGHYKALAKDKTLPKESRDLYSTVTQGLKVILNACFTGDTLVVTPTGVRNIKDFRVGDKVVNVNPETLRVEVDEVVEVQSFSYDGDLYHFSDGRFVDLMVTPNHRFLTLDGRKASSSGAKFVTAEELGNLTNVSIPKLRGGIERDQGLSRISLLGVAQETGAYASLYPPKGVRLVDWFGTLPSQLQNKIRSERRASKPGLQASSATGRKSKRSRYLLPATAVTEEDIDSVEASGGRATLGEEHSRQIPARYHARDLATLCGRLVSEWDCHSASGRMRGDTAAPAISQGYGNGDPVHREYGDQMSGFIGEQGLSIDDSTPNGHLVAGSILDRWAVSQCYVQGKTHPARALRIPEFVFESSENMRRFLDSVCKRDGGRSPSGCSTVGTLLAQQMVVLLSHLGYKTRLTYDVDSRTYNILFKDTSSKLTYDGAERTKNLTVIPYRGTVYCVTTKKNHTVMAGRNGRFVPVGQSYGVMGFETFALYCLPVADATAAFGRDAITRTIEKCKKEGVSVIYSDSVTAERCVTVMDPAGLVRVMPISEFFDSSGQVITRSDGKEEAHPKGWKTLSTSIETGDTEWKQVNAVIRHRNEKKIYRVWDKFGSTRVTGDHSLVADSGGVRVLSKPQDLRGRHLVRVSRVPRGENIELIDTFKILESVKYRVRYKGRWKTLEAHCDESSVWYSWTKRAKPIKLKRFIKVGSLEFTALVELLGAYVPEGSSSTPETTRSRIGASIACSDVQWLERQRENYYTLFSDAKASIIESNPGIRDLTYLSASGRTMQVLYQDKTHKLQMMNKVSAVFFKAFCGQKSYGKRLPDFIFNAPDEFKRLMLENLIKGDGSRSYGEAYSQEYRLKNFKYESKSLRLISGLSTLLLQLGVNHTVGYRPSKKTHAIATSTSYNNTKRSPRTIEESYEGYVYDLSVEGHHTFADSCGSVVLKNTDSLFIENPDKEKVAGVLRWAEKELGVELEVDKTYRYVAFSQLKKNYFGVLQDGTADIKGLTGKKSQTPEFLKTRFYSVLDILGNVYSKDDFEQAKSRIKKLLTEMVASLKDRKVPVQDLSFNVMMGKSISGYKTTRGPEPGKPKAVSQESLFGQREQEPAPRTFDGSSMSGLPQHVKAAMMLSQSTGSEVKAGELISFVKTKGGQGVKPSSQARPEDIDVDKYIEYASSMFDQVLSALDLSFEQVVPKSSLDAFWS